MKNKSAIAIPAAVLLVFGIAFASLTITTFAQSANDKSGTISSIQNGAGGKPEWKVSGTWNFTNLNSNSPKFHATFGMEKLDGSSKHKHTIIDFNPEGSPMKGNDGTVYNGTATISLKGGPVHNVPVSIKLMNNGDFSIMIDQKLTNNHFGNTPISGKITT